MLPCLSLLLWLSMIAILIKLVVHYRLQRKFTKHSQQGMHGVCCITTNWNYFNGTNVANFHKYRRFLFHLALDLAGGIHLHGLVPLQSIEKNLGGAAQEYVWMGGLHALCWMVAYVIKNHPKLLQKSDNKLVCIVIPSGNPRLEHSSIIWRFWCI